MNNNNDAAVEEYGLTIADDLTAAKAAILNASPISPVNGVNGNVIEMLQGITNAYGVIVSSTISSNNSEVGSDGNISYSLSAINGDITVTLIKGTTEETVSVLVDVPAIIPSSASSGGGSSGGGGGGGGGFIPTPTPVATSTSSTSNNSTTRVLQLQLLNTLIAQLQALLEKEQSAGGVLTPAELQLLNGGTTTSPMSTKISFSFHFSTDMGLGTVSASVKTLQRVLNAIGFEVAASGPGSPGKETTRFGQATSNALKRYQESVGISATGYLGSLTRKSLNAL